MIAARGGGALETVVDGKTGWHFSTTDESELIALLLQSKAWDTNRIQEHAAGFGREAFEAHIQKLVSDTVRPSR